MDYMRKGEWLELRVPRGVAKTDGQPDVDEWLRDRLAVPDDYIRKMRAREDIRQTGERVMLRLFTDREPGFPPRWRPLVVLHEDDFCLVIDKPAGVSVHPARPDQADTLANAVAAYYESTGQHCAVRHVHRMDKWTSGAVLYAKNGFGLHQLDRAMRDKKIGRAYLAVVRGVPAHKRGTIRAPIGKDRHVPGKRRISARGAAAVTHYAVVDTFPGAALLRLTLETGRTHQIRVHLSHIGHPILGDALYGGDARMIARQALHGAEIRFPHPFGMADLTVASPLPDDIEALIRRLRQTR